MRGVIDRVESRIRAAMSGEATGHDWYHVDQVRNMALRIAGTEGGDAEIIGLAALVHDIGDRKFYESKEAGRVVTVSVLIDADVSAEVIEKIMHIVDTMSFSTGMIPESLEGKIVQDADRMYALGAIGITRAFAFGGKKGRVIHDPAQPLEYPSTVNHFYEKLLLIKDRMNTETGKKIAESRHRYMEGFLEQFYKEWEAQD